MSKLLPKFEAAKLPALYATDGDTEALYPVKFFGILKASGWTWYAKEFDGEDTFFGLVTSPMCPNGELGYFTLSELAGLTAMGGTLPLVERDEWWTPATLAELKKGSS